MDGSEPDWSLIEEIERAIAVPNDFSEKEEVSEHLKQGSEVKECPVCGKPVPRARDDPELKERTVGHEKCLQRALKELNANVDLCLHRPGDLEG